MFLTYLSRSSRGNLRRQASSNAIQAGQQRQQAQLAIRQQEQETRRLELENDRLELELTQLRETLRVEAERRERGRE
jgi:hypothetical protein